MTPCGKLRERVQPVDHLLAGFPVVGVVGELALDVGEPGDRRAAEVFETGHAVEGDLDRNADQALHLLGAGAGVLGDDLDQGGRRVGIRLDVQVPRRMEPAMTRSTVARMTIRRLCRLHVMIARTMIRRPLRATRAGFLVKATEPERDRCTGWAGTLGDPGRPGLPLFCTMERVDGIDETLSIVVDGRGTREIESGLQGGFGLRIASLASLAERGATRLFEAMVRQRPSQAGAAHQFALHVPLQERAKS